MSNKLFLLPALLGAMLLFSPACDKDNCKNVECANGTCFEGVCDCDAGYETDAEGVCTVESRTKLLGTYNTSETCDGTPTGSYSNSITASGADISKVIISNFGDSGLNATATVTGDDVTVDAATFNIGGTSYEVTGDGTVSGSTVTITYQARAGGVVAFTCSMTMTKI
jgi:hypothetical protein